MTRWYEVYFLMHRVSDMCTKESCPEMSAGPHYSYYWTDFNGSNPVPVGASDEVES